MPPLYTAEQPQVWSAMKPSGVFYMHQRLNCVCGMTWILISSQPLDTSTLQAYAKPHWPIILTPQHLAYIFPKRQNVALTFFHLPSEQLILVTFTDVQSMLQDPAKFKVRGCSFCSIGPDCN